jgi:dTDP-4-dehydrorhamnose 3,5-epimerase
MLKGVKIKSLNRHYDERGSFTELLRTDWEQLLNQDRLVQANLSITYPKTIRAWHRHSQDQIDYLIALKGAIKICAYDDNTEHLNEIISSGEDPQIVRIPGHYWHGFKALGNVTVHLLYFTTQLYNYQAPDEERRPWNDPTIQPSTINGRVDDPRIGKPWNWNYPPHK